MKVKVAKGIVNFSGIMVKSGKKFNTYEMLSHEFQRLVGMFQTSNTVVWYVTKGNLAGFVKLGDRWPTAELVELEVITGGEVLVKWSIGK